MIQSFYSKIRLKIKRSLRSYSRMILVVKTWLFSLAALGISLFFIYPQISEQQKLFDVVISSDIFSEAQSLKITNIRFYGVDESNTPYIVTADSAEEKKVGSKILTLAYPMADIVTDNGDAINITSVSGVINQKDELIMLTDKVEVFSTQGYEIRTDELNFDMKTNSISSSKPIDAKGDFGYAKAEGIQIANKGDKIIFKGKTTINLFER